jgi:thiol-disulfide isomerase/thioredoxin
MRVLILTLLGCLLAGCGSNGSAAADRGKAPNSQAGGSPAGVPLRKLDRSHAGTAAPDVTFLSRDGTTAKVADFKGKRVLVNLWATWCAPCIAELPELDAMAQGEIMRLTVLTISQDLGGWLAVDKFWSPGKFETITPRLDKQGNFATAMKAQGLPVSVLYDARGREVWRVNGPMKWTTPAVLAALR